ncbi:MAG: cytochrome [Acidimicrobiia bacterium]|nr:cytochrome [Acidimicrobiia bacterium]
MYDASEMTPLGQRIDLAENHLPTYTPLRQAGSMIRNDGFVPAITDWIATDRETITYIFRHPELFSSARTSTQLGNTRPTIPLEVDPPEHHRYRRLLDPFFSPNKLRPLESALRDQINDFIDGFIDKGSVDLLEEFFVPYPTQVFLTMYGLPLEDRPTFLRWKDAMIRGSMLDPEAGKRAGEEFYAYMERYLASGSADGADLMSQLRRPNEQGEQLTNNEILDITYLFILAGLDTVTTALVHSFAYLARHPDERRRIAEEPTIVPSAVEELIRAGNPAPALTRIATQDVEVGGVLMREGEGVYCHLGAANGDPAEWPNAEEIDLTRPDNRHASFGLGIHRCLGSHLARMEVRLVMDEFHRRIPDYHLAPEADLVRVPFFEGVDALPIVFPPGGRDLQIM